MKAASAPDLNFMVQYLPLFLADLASTLLNHMGEGFIGSWNDLEREFYNHFERAQLGVGTLWVQMRVERKPA